MKTKAGSSFMRMWSTGGILGGAFLGLICGLTVGPAMGVVEWMGTLFLSALRFLVLPLVITALVVGVTSLGDVRRVGKFGGLTLAYFLSTTAIAVTIGIILVVVIKPGVGMTMGDLTLPQRIAAKSRLTFGDFVLSFVGGGATHRANLFYSLAQMEMLPLIIFSLIFGGVLTTIGEAGKPVIALFRGCYEAIMKIISGVLLFAPFGIFGLVASIMGRLGAGGLGRVGMYITTVLTGLFIHGVIVLPCLLWFLAKRSPREYARGVYQALIVAFSTASSAATLPVTTQNVIQRNGISERTANFVLPIGATMNMDGTALYEGVAVIFFAQALGITLSFQQMVLILLLATLAAVAAAAVPEAGLVTMVIILEAVHIPIESIGMILAVDWFLDRCRTTVNVWGDATGAALLDRWSRQAPSIKLEAL